ncbi:hypothetical protein [Streptomyces zagrosensis]|uniref:Secreted protein n=1 Tax=Streptomyces zagrosensis TaxID=1042984 RepID=A0A7W9QFR4_9ACTN|nr:hypothetical protein [Streptomyces zagrosensis]MBB5938197.1 hypothetical protein [Streptomyces zagrosensis]
MSIRFTAKARGALAVGAVAVSASLLMTGCGGGGDADDKPAKEQSAGAGNAPKGEGGKSDTPEPIGEPIAELRGEKGMVLTLTEAKRDAGGFLTVNGQVENTSDKIYTGANKWRGDETEILKHGSSIAGATLIDSGGKKRYYVLRDTEGRCLCTMSLVTIKAGVTVPVFMQFPAPPEEVDEVQFQLPTFPSATIKIAG